MKVYVAYGCKERDKWIEEMAIPVIEALGLEVIHGKEMPGMKLSDEIKKSIISCDLLVGFLTRRDDLGDGKFSTHGWVRDEIVVAITAGLLFIPVVENGVDFQACILGDVSWMIYDETRRDAFLVNLIKAVADKSKMFAALPIQKKMLIRLEPGTFHNRIKSLLNNDEPLDCKYRFANESGESLEESHWLYGKIKKVLGGVGIEVDMKYIPVPEHIEKATIEVRVKVDQERWDSEPYLLNQPLKSIQLSQLPSSTEEEKHIKAQVSESVNPERTIRIFLASSSELQEDRDNFDLYFRQQNDKLRKLGVYIEIIRWENFLDAMSETRLQDEYNQEVRNCDIFVSLFFTKTGKFTEEEFNTAHKKFRQTGKPQIYTFFKNADIKTGSLKKQDFISLYNFQARLSELGHYYTNYDNIEDLKLQFRDQLDKLIGKGD